MKSCSRRRPCLVLLVGGLAVLAGCAARVTVTGKVLENGNPVPRAELSWMSETDPAVFGTALSDPTGAYVVESGGKRGLPPGRYQVRVIVWRTRDGRPLPEGEAGAALKGTPRARQFTATLSHDVAAEAGTVDLDLTGKLLPVKED
jgi:hypothetical protein